MERFLLDTGVLLGFIREASWALWARSNLGLGEQTTMVFTSIICRGELLALAEKRGWGSSAETRKVIGQFDADKVSSDGGVVLLREAEHRFRVIKRFSECFTDYRNPDLITHSLFSIVGQRVLGICCGYEDVNDHDQFRADPLRECSAELPPRLRAKAL